MLSGNELLRAVVSILSKRRGLRRRSFRAGWSYALYGGLGFNQQGNAYLGRHGDGSNV